MHARLRAANEPRLSSSAPGFVKLHDRKNDDFMPLAFGCFCRRCDSRGSRANRRGFRCPLESLERVRLGLLSFEDVFVEVFFLVFDTGLVIVR